MKQIKEHFFTPTLATALVVASGLILVGICTYLVIKPPALKKAIVETQQVAKNQALVKNYTISYPSFRIEKVDMALRNYATHKVDDFLKRFGHNDPGAYLNITYSLLHYDTQTATVQFNEKVRAQNVAEEQQRTFITFDLKQQKQINFPDVFNDQMPAQTFIARILRDYFKQNAPGVLSYAEQQSLLQFTLANVKDYTIDDNAIVMYVNPRNLNSPKGRTAISIKKALFQGLLRSEYAEARASITPRIIEPATYSIDVLPPADKAIDPNGKLLAITFDDGPGVLTPRVLDTLKQYDARATFFVIGRQVPTYASTVLRAATEGHEIGNHSWAHPNLTRLPPEQLQQQINDTQQAVKHATGGYVPKVMRPPEGVYNENVLAFLRAQGLRVELWSVDTQDWLYRDTQVVYNRIMASAGDGRVILLHDIHQSSVDAALRAIPELVGQGYQLVTVSELHQYR